MGEPREFWIVNTDTHVDQVYHKDPGPNAADHVDIIHVIERSGYEKLKKECEHAALTAANISKKNVELHMELAELKELRMHIATTLRKDCDKWIDIATEARIEINKIQKELAESKEKSSWNRIKPLCEEVEALREERDEYREVLSSLENDARQMPDFAWKWVKGVLAKYPKES